MSLTEFKLGIFHLQLNNILAGFWTVGSKKLNVKNFKATLDGNLRYISSLPFI